MTFWRLVCISVSAAAWLALKCAAAEHAVAIRLSASGDRVEVAGAPPELLAAIQRGNGEADAWRKTLRVEVASDAASAPAPVLGRRMVEGDLLIFKPRFPFRPGLRYRVVFEPAAVIKGASSFETTVAIVSLPGDRAAEPAFVEGVFPSGDELPENLLKFYLHFSAPMARGQAYRHVHLVQADGKAATDAFLEVGEELWDADGRRLTLLFDPGRIKRGLKPNEDVGAPLVVGREYTLVIDRDWRNAQGATLRESYQKSFKVTAPDRDKPNPSQWRISPPPPDSVVPLVVEFDEPLDHALAQRTITIADQAGAAVEGTAEVEAHETRWTFKPDAAWRSGGYTLTIDPVLEDRAGNSVGRAFEVLNPTQETDAASHRPVTLSFEVGPR